MRTLAVALAGVLALALAAPAAAAPAAFPDVEGHWARAEIERGVELGFLDGYPDGLFRPEGTVTRAEFVKMVAAAFGLEGQGAAVFEDARGRWFEPYVAAACEEGVVVPDELGGFFLPDEAIPRAEAAAYLVRALGRGGSAALREAGESPFSDIAQVPGAWRGAVAEAYLIGILKGYPDGTVAGWAGSTRAEAVTMLLRALGCRQMAAEVPPASVAPEGGEARYTVTGSLLGKDAEAGRKWEVPVEGRFALAWEPGGPVRVSGARGLQGYAQGKVPDPAALASLLAGVPEPDQAWGMGFLALLAVPWPKEVTAADLGKPGEVVNLAWEDGAKRLALRGHAGGLEPVAVEGELLLRRNVVLSWEGELGGNLSSGDLSATVLYEPDRLQARTVSVLLHATWEGERQVVVSGQFGAEAD